MRRIIIIILFLISSGGIHSFFVTTVSRRFMVGGLSTQRSWLSGENNSEKWVRRCDHHFSSTLPLDACPLLLLSSRARQTTGFCHGLGHVGDDQWTYCREQRAISRVLVIPFLVGGTDGYILLGVHGPTQTLPSHFDCPTPSINPRVHQKFYGHIVYDGNRRVSRRLRFLWISVDRHKYPC